MNGSLKGKILAKLETRAHAMEEGEVVALGEVDLALAPLDVL
jgi:hypothetical protein